MKKNKFVKVTPENAIELFQNGIINLDGALCLYLNALTPFQENVVEINFNDLAEVFGRDKSAISRAYKKSVQANWINPRQFKTNTKTKYPSDVKLKFAKEKSKPKYKNKLQKPQQELQKPQQELQNPQNKLQSSQLETAETYEETESQDYKNIKNNKNIKKESNSFATKETPRLREEINFNNSGMSESDYYYKKDIHGLTHADYDVLLGRGFSLEEIIEMSMVKEISQEVDF